jgi:lysyl-tRNA synthetase class 2
LEVLNNMPPSAGIAMGIDRLVMVFLDAATIDEVVAFTPEEL